MDNQVKVTLCALPPFFLAVLIAGCSTQDPQPAQTTRLKSVTTSLMNNQGEFALTEKRDYDYLSSKLLKVNQSYYDLSTKSFSLFSTSNLTFEGGLLKSIETRLEDSGQTTVTKYEYLNDKVSRILVDDDVDIEATVKYLPDNGIEVLYKNSNGTSYTYHFTLRNSDVDDEKVFGQANELASTQSHEYDTHRNPFTLLGYTDLFFTYVSANNKVKSTSEYFGSFPTLVPVSYEYQYNNEDLPTEQITTYIHYPAGTSSSQAKTTFEYQ